PRETHRTAPPGRRPQPNCAGPENAPVLERGASVWSTPAGRSVALTRQPDDLKWGEISYGRRLLAILRFLPQRSVRPAPAAPPFVVCNTKIGLCRSVTPLERGNRRQSSPRQGRPPAQTYCHFLIAKIV